MVTKGVLEVAERLVIVIMAGFLILLLFINFLLPRTQLPLSGSTAFEPIALSMDEQSLLLQLARSQLEAVVASEPLISVEPAELLKNLKRHAACFVSLFVGDNLRGCMIDDFQPHESLVQNVLRNVVLAATGDERSSPVTADELSSIRIEISVLGRLKELRFESPQELLEKLSPRVDGVIITSSHGQSVYLPWVWEVFPDPEVFLPQLCEKQGAPADCWRTQPPPKVEIFRVTHFCEANGKS